MGNVFISPNPKKETVQIDLNGNEVIPFTKQVIKKNEDIEEPSKPETKPIVEDIKQDESILPG